MKRLVWQAIHFFGLSGIGWCIDFGIYVLLSVISKNLFYNNIICSLAGVTFVFMYATRKVFINNSKISLKWKYIVYILYQCILIWLVSKVLDGINSALLFYIQGEQILRFSAILSKILVTPVTMILNFIVMKSVIERL